MLLARATFVNLTRPAKRPVNASRYLELLQALPAVAG